MFKEFFVDEVVGINFKLFGRIHFGCILITLASLVMIFLLRKRIKNMPMKSKKRILKIAACMMLCNMIIYNITKLYYGTFDYKKDLPFHLCFVSGYLFMYGILFDNKEILKMTFFLSFIGPLPAMIYPELPSAFDSMRFYEYFISHHFFMISSFFCFFAYDLDISWKDVVRTYLFASALFFLMMPINKIWGCNYVFSSGIPKFIKDLYPFLNHIHPVIVLEILGTSILLIMYQFVRWMRKEKGLHPKI